MPKRIALTTPQFRTKLLRKLKNLYPQCSVEFLESERGALRFRLIDAESRSCSDVVYLPRYVDGILTRESLGSRIRLLARARQSQGSKERGR